MDDFQQIEILLVEDSKTDAELTMRALEKNGVANHVIWVRDGAEAIDFIFCQGAYEGRSNVFPRLVLLDLRMPKLDGIDVLRRIKTDERTKGIPVVVLTSSAEESDIIRSYQLGVNSYLVKPVDFGKFIDEVSKAGCYWVLMNKIPRAP